MTPKDFFENFSVPSIALYQADEMRHFELCGNSGPQQEIDAARIAMKRSAATAAIWTYHVHDWVWGAYGAGSAQVFDNSKIEGYRNHLKGLCPDFDVVANIADAAKHYSLRDQQRHPSKFADVLSLSFAWGEGRWGEFAFGGGEQLIAINAAGAKVGVTFALMQTMQMWRDLDAQGRL